MGDSYWRGIASPIISRVLTETLGKPEKEIRKALREAYPKLWGRSGWPYKVWLDEIRRQRGTKRLLRGTARRDGQVARHAHARGESLHGRLAEVKAGRW